MKLQPYNELTRLTQILDNVQGLNQEKDSTAGTAAWLFRKSHESTYAQVTSNGILWSAAHDGDFPRLPLQPNGQTQYVHTTLKVLQVTL